MQSTVSTFPVHPIDHAALCGVEENTARTLPLEPGWPPILQPKGGRLVLVARDLFALEMGRSAGYRGRKQRHGGLWVQEVCCHSNVSPVLLEWL